MSNQFCLVAIEISCQSRFETHVIRSSSRLGTNYAKQADESVVVRYANGFRGNTAILFIHIVIVAQWQAYTSRVVPAGLERRRLACAARHQAALPFEVLVH